MKIVSKIRTVGKIVEKVYDQLKAVEVPEKVVSHVEFAEADKTAHELSKLNNELKATIEVAKEPFLKELKKIDTETKETRDTISDGIESTKSLMVKWFERYPNTELEAGTTMAVVKDIEITDISKVPEEYYEIAKAAILKDLSAGKKIPGVKLTESYQVRITEKKF